MKCIVYGCENHDHQGEFINEMCMPCYNIITTGELKPTSSFLKRLNDGIYGFYEDRYPHYTSYKNAHSELSYLVYPDELNKLVKRVVKLEQFAHYIATDYVELSHDKVRWQRDDYIKKAREVLDRCGDD